MELNLEEIRARLGASTPGDWAVDSLYDHGGDGVLNVTESSEDDLHWIVDPEHAPMMPNDAAFIAHSRRDVGGLLAEVERLRMALQEAQAK